MLWTSVPATEMKPHRPQKYAAYKAHTILPESLRGLVKKHGHSLFAGLERGMTLKPESIDADFILKQTQKITAMVDNRARFSDVVKQMGFVAGIVAVYTDPSRQSSAVVRTGFNYYLNKKLQRCLFVFDGYPAPENIHGWLQHQLSEVPVRSRQYRTLLEDRYQRVNGNTRHLFGERSAVFGISSIYFSNMARLSAHLWYYAWVSAHGDLTVMPFKGRLAAP